MVKYLVAFVLYFLIVPVVNAQTDRESDVVAEACFAMKKKIAYLSCMEKEILKKRAKHCLPVDQGLMGNPFMIELGELSILCTFDIDGYCIPGEDMNMCRNRQYLETNKCIKELVTSVRETLCFEPKPLFTKQAI
jgi:hypothetical protein